MERLKEKVVSFIEMNKIIAICRGIYGEDLLKLVSALKKGGVKLVEVTFDQGDESSLDKTSKAIKELVHNFGEKVIIGAGTVITLEQVYVAREAGAKYIISPNVNKEIIKASNKLNLVTIPGAMTPTEIIKAHLAGADFVKLFPAGTLGIRYAKDILGPINNVRFIATAGITSENLGEFLSLGFAGVGISNYLTNKELVKKGDFETLTKHGEILMNIVEKHK